MNTPRTCPKCGAALPADAPAGLCPKCRLNRRLESSPESAPPPGKTMAIGEADLVPPAGPSDSSPATGHPPLGRVRTLATTSCWRKSPTAAWAWSIRRGRSASIGPSPSR
jgi:hypothetical protein